MIDNENVKLLIKVMDLQPPKPHSLEVTRYEHVKGVGIVISQIKVLDEQGEYIKFAKLEGVSSFLDKYPIKFKPDVGK